MIKNGDNVVLKFNHDGEICRQRCKAYIYESMDYAIKYSHPNETLVEYAPVKRGRWIMGLDGGCMCSECKEVSRYESGDYCTFCGSKLEYKEEVKI